MIQKTKLTLLTISVVSLIGFGQTALATQPSDVSGDFNVTILGFPDFKQNGKQCIITLPAQFTLTGDVDGMFASEFRIIHFGDCFEPAREKFMTNGNFVGSVNGEFGSFDFTFQGKIDENSIAKGDLVIQKGKDSLENLHGKITLQGLSGVGGSYQGSIHFDP